MVQSYEYRLLSKDKTTRSNWEAHLDLRQLECQSLKVFLVPLYHNEYLQMRAMTPMLDIHCTKD